MNQKEKLIEATIKALQGDIKALDDQDIVDTLTEYLISNMHFQKQYRNLYTTYKGVIIYTFFSSWQGLLYYKPYLYISLYDSYKNIVKQFANDDQYNMFNTDSECESFVTDYVVKKVYKALDIDSIIYRGYFANNKSGFSGIYCYFGKSTLEDTISELNEAMSWCMSKIDTIMDICSNEIPKAFEQYNNRNKTDGIKYTIVYFLNSATANRTGGSRQQINDDYITSTIYFDSDLQAFEYIITDIYNQKVEDVYGNNTNISDDDKIQKIMDYIKYMNEDLGYGDPIVIRINSKKYKYNSHITKQDLLDELA